MKGRFRLSSPMAAAVAAGMIVSMLFLSYFLSSGFYGASSEPPPLSAPTLEDGPSSGAENLQRVAAVEITPQNIQQVIEALGRSESYTQTVGNTLYYGTERSTQVVTQYVWGGVCRTDVLRGGGVAESYLRAGDDFYAWQGGGNYFHGASGDFSADSMAMLPNWRTVVDLPADAIVSAELVILEGEPILMVGTAAGERRIDYSISAISGLLTGAHYYEGEELIRELHITNITMGEPDASHFLLPDGKSVLT